MKNISQITIADDEAAGLLEVLLFDNEQPQEMARIEVRLPNEGEAKGSCLVTVDGREYEATARMSVRGGKPTGKLTISLSSVPVMHPTVNVIKSATWNQLADDQEWQETGEGYARTVEARPKLTIDYSQPA